MKKIILLVGILINITAFASPVEHPLYAGISAGYGVADWNSLANHDSNPDNASSVLEGVPDKAADRGLDYGAFIGYTFTPNYALELSYRKFKTVQIYFTEDSTYTPPASPNSYPDIRSTTFNFSLVNKIMLPLPDNFSLFSGLGPSLTYQSNPISKRTQQAGATFAVGANYEITEHFMATLEGDYTTGWGKSEEQPVNHYVPFLYSGDFKLAYRF